MPARLLVCSLGLLPYPDALELQRAAAHARISGDLRDDLLILVEHPPVVTLGRSSKDAHLVASPALLAARGVERYEVDRGGDVTFHGPGQLVGYPIFDLKRHRQDLHWYLRQLEEVLIRAVQPMGISGIRNPGYTGVWVQDRKLASIGVHARDWVTWHGFALNVTTDLSWFDLIVPCGIPGVTMTSVERELASRSTSSPGEGHGEWNGISRHAESGRESLDIVSPAAVRESVVRGFETVFSMTAEPLAYEALVALTTGSAVVA